MSSKLFLTNGNGTIFQNPTSVTFKTLEHFENYFHLSKGYFLCIFHLFFESKMYEYRTFKGETYSNCKYTDRDTYIQPKTITGRLYIIIDLIFFPF